MIAVHGSLNVCVVIAGCQESYHKGLVEIEIYVGWELPAKAPKDPVWLLSQVYIHFLHSSDIITYYYVPHIYNFMLFVCVIKLLIILYLVH